MGEGPWDLKNDTVVSLLGLLFNLMCIRHGNEKNWQQEMSNNKGKSKTHKKPAFSIQRTRKGASFYDWCFRKYQITALFQPNNKEKTVAHPHAWQQKLSGEPRLPWESFWEPSPPAGRERVLGEDHVRGGYVESWDFHPHWVEMMAFSVRGNQ